ncbi:MAG: hypothetical protein WEB60_11185 [Terrimicrobiaceae bacterium]
MIFLFTAGLACAQSEPTASPTPAPASEVVTPTPEVTPEATSEPTPGAATETTTATTVETIETTVTDLPTSEVGTLESLEPSSEGAPLTTEDVIPLPPRTDFALPDEAFTDPNAIVPDEMPLAPPPAVVVESEAEKLRELNIRYREVRVKAEQDPQVVRMMERADGATTLEDRRAALREYYRLLFKKVASLDSSLKMKSEMMQEAYIRRLAQIRLEPTIPLNPPPTPEPLN